MARLKPTEVRLIASLIDPDGENPDAATALAGEIITALDDKREGDDQWIICARLAQWAPITAYGTWSTLNQAMKFAKNLSGEGQPRAVAIKITPEDEVLKRLRITA